MSYFPLPENGINGVNKNILATERDLANAALISKSEQPELSGPDNLQENPKVAKLCSPLLVLSVIFSGFAYGSILVR